MTSVRSVEARGSAPEQNGDARPSAHRPSLDVGSPVRSGEELNVAAVDAYLKAVDPTLAGTPRVTQYAGGASNWTYRLEYDNRDLILRRPPAGTKAKSAHDMGREYRVQKALKPVYPWVPEMVAYCQDEAVLGSEFYVMERIAGIIPRARMPASSFTPLEAKKLCENAIDKLVALHRVDATQPELAALGKGKGYSRRQVEGWSDRFDKARTPNVFTFKRVKAWLRDHTPDDVATCVIHGDFRLDNLVLAADDVTRVIGVLDWEMATVGDPLMDLGNSLAYWVEAKDDRLYSMIRRQPTQLPGMLKRAEVVERYCGAMGLSPRNWAFYEVYGLFRLAVIAQQIYYRYYHKQTQNPAFKNYWILINYLALRCEFIARRSRL
jgi:aminoglycoside phosphotransferase (APT) family kinase protein